MYSYSSIVGKVVIGASIALHAPALSSSYAELPHQGSLEAAFALYDTERFSEAALNLRLFAQQGNARAQLYLATLYRTGTGVEEDEYEAAEWYARAARQGVAEAQFHLGLMYLEGIGVTEDSHKALEWISRAAKQGFGDAVDVFHYMLSHDQEMGC